MIFLCKNDNFVGCSIKNLKKDNFKFVKHKKLLNAIILKK